MVTDDKQRGALRALNFLLVVARSMAFEGEAAALVEVLETAEYLPMLMLEQADRTREFRASLEGLAARSPRFADAVQRFDHD